MNKKAFVTGGSRGIGRGIIESLAADGFDIFFTYNTDEKSALEAAQTLQQKYHVQCGYMQAALEEPGGARKAFDAAVEFLGGLDLLVNNAGTTIFQNILDLNEQILDALIELDFKTFMLMMHYAAVYMVEHQIKGNIINITSTRGERAYPSDSLYGALKAGLNRASKSIALDLAPYGIRVNCIAPGAICTRSREEMKAVYGENTPYFWDLIAEKVPLERAGTPSDIGAAVCFLASDSANYITGLTLNVDGGLILPGMPETNSSNAWGRETEETRAENQALSQYVLHILNQKKQKTHNASEGGSV